MIEEEEVAIVAVVIETEAIEVIEVVKDAVVVAIEIRHPLSSSAT